MRSERIEADESADATTEFDTPQPDHPPLPPNDSSTAADAAPTQGAPKLTQEMQESATALGKAAKKKAKVTSVKNAYSALEENMNAKAKAKKDQRNAKEMEKKTNESVLERYFKGLENSSQGKKTDIPPAERAQPTAEEDTFQQTERKQRNNARFKQENPTPEGQQSINSISAKDFLKFFNEMQQKDWNGDVVIIVNDYDYVWIGGPADRATPKLIFQVRKKDEKLEYFFQGQSVDSIEVSPERPMYSTFTMVSVLSHDLVTTPLAILNDTHVLTKNVEMPNVRVRGIRANRMMEQIGMKERKNWAGIVRFTLDSKDFLGHDPRDEIQNLVFEFELATQEGKDFSRVVEYAFTRGDRPRLIVPNIEIIEDGEGKYRTQVKVIFVKKYEGNETVKYFKLFPIITCMPSATRMKMQEIEKEGESWEVFQQRGRE